MPARLKFAMWLEAILNVARIGYALISKRRRDGRLVVARGNHTPSLKRPHIMDLSPFRYLALCPSVARCKVFSTPISRTSSPGKSVLRDSLTLPRGITCYPHKLKGSKVPSSPPCALPEFHPWANGHSLILVSIISSFPLLAFRTSISRYICFHDDCDLSSVRLS